MTDATPDARARDLRCNATRTALFIIDKQCDVVKDGRLGVALGNDVAWLRATIPGARNQPAPGPEQGSW